MCFVKKKTKGKCSLNFVDDIAAFNFPWLRFLIALTYRFVPDTKLMDRVCETEQESEVQRLWILWKKKKGTTAGSTALSDLASLTSLPEAHSLYWKEHNHVSILLPSLWELNILVLYATWLCRMTYENPLRPCRVVSFLWGRAGSLWQPDVVPMCRVVCTTGFQEGIK